jgi:hypothetical protein
MQPFLRINVFKIGQNLNFSKIKKMKLKLFYLALFGLFLTQIAESSAQGLVIKLKDGSTNIENLNAIQKLSFTEIDLLETLTTGTVNSFALSSVQKLYFDMTIAIEENAVSETTGLTIYPNPAQETINITGIPGQAEFVFVYRTDGKLVITEPVTSGIVSINISKLTHGLYFVIAEGVSSKFIKL